MLLHIKIKDFAIIEELDLDFQPGLTVITGETGAGKSIVIEGISVALGSRADTDFIRSGKEKATIELLLDTEDQKSKQILLENGIPDDDQSIIKREITKVGKSICRINGEIVPLSLLNKLCRGLADIHGQYDHQSLLNIDHHLSVLDSFGGEIVENARINVEKSFDQYSDCHKELSRLNSNLEQAQRQRDFMSFEWNEIQEVAPVVGEDETLSAKIALLENSQTIFIALSEAQELLFSQEGAATDLLGHVMNSFANLASFSKDLSNFHEEISDSYYKLEDLSDRIRRYKEAITFLPEELEMAYQRIDLLENLKRKHGDSIESVLNYAEKIEKELCEIEDADHRIAELETKLSAFKENLALASLQLSKLRHQAATELSQRINEELRELNFKDAHFEIAFKETEDTAFSRLGIDHIEFLISANKGELPKPLAKVASGGELSRIMLAMKRITGDLDSIPTLIFDEIDNGISGITASIVGKKLLQIAEKHQVICITHLPQIAACGEHHDKIQKISGEEKTCTTVLPLSEKERISEIARLLGGINITETTHKSAEELLTLSKKQSC